MKRKKLIKHFLNIKNFRLTYRKKIQKIESLWFRRKYTAADVVDAMKDLGMKEGDTIIVHCAMNNFYNYRGSVRELIDAILEALGPKGTLCMPAFPPSKRDSTQVFDVRNSKSAAGILSETFRKYPGVKRSLNQLHSVCALGPNAEYLVSDHHESEICFDEHSPFFKLGELQGLSFTLGLPKYFIGTILHVSEALTAKDIPYFRNRYLNEVTYKYINEKGERLTHTMKAEASTSYVRYHNTKFVDTYFEKTKYGHRRLSNIWINCYDVNYTIKRLTELAYQGKSVYKYPKFRIK